MRRALRLINRSVLVVGILMAGVVHAPQVLAFPYHARSGTTDIWSEAPIGPAMGRVLARADARVAASPLAGSDLSRRLFLTDGGWRWRLLALTSANSFGVRRPFSSALVFNRSDLATDRVGSRRAGGRTRSLSGTIAHETSHLLVARRIGEIAALRLPNWVSEGLADHVGGESTLSDAAAARARRDAPGDRALAYYDARRRVAAVLRANGGDVDALLR